MKTVGDILKSERLGRGLTIEGLSRLTKIDPKYIESLESNQFDLLPSATFAKGFVRNLAISLNKDPGEMVALFRRDYQESFKASPLLKRTKPFKLNQVLNSQATLWIVGASVFLIYLVFQYRAVLTPPKLTLSSPTNNAVLSSPVTVEGETQVGAVIDINDGLKITPDSTGHFATKLTFDNGESKISITSTTRFGRSTTKTIPITILSQ